MQSSDHLPKLFKPQNRDKNYSELLTLAENYIQDKVTPVLVDCLYRQVTCEQSKSKYCFRFRAGRITASRLKQDTDPHQPSLSFLKSVCYPEIHRFSIKATSWGCTYEKFKDALQVYETNAGSHEELRI